MIFLHFCKNSVIEEKEEEEEESVLEKKNGSSQPLRQSKSKLKPTIKG